MGDKKHNCEIIGGPIPDNPIYTAEEMKRKIDEWINDKGCDVCRGGCPDKDHHVTRRFCEECFQADYIGVMKLMQSRLAQPEKVAEAARTTVGCPNCHVCSDRISAALDAAKEGK